MTLLGASRSPPALLYYLLVTSGSCGQDLGSQTVLTPQSFAVVGIQYPLAGPAALTSSHNSKMEMFVLAGNTAHHLPGKSLGSFHSRSIANYLSFYVSH